jgi:acetyl-CoA carboxylase carboxyltransferase component/biotin carboxyl carrier protein
VQIAGDIYGNCIALSGRDCSVQRRHQKVIEEGPPSIVPDDVFVNMQKDAIKLGKAVNYVNLGTVEFLFCPETNEYFFLELNPRLQVEHTVTELITGLNLPALQVDIAMGMNVNTIDFEINNHVIACRITAENEFFKPTTGNIEQIKFDSYPDTFGYFSVQQGSKIHSFSDSQFGHIFITKDTRDKCINQALRVLDTLIVKGTISSSIQNLRWIVNSQEFKKNTHDTKWLDNMILNKKIGTKPSELHIAFISAIRAKLNFEAQIQEFKNALVRGGEPVCLPGINSYIKFIVNGHKVSLNVTLIDKSTYRIDNMLDVKFENEHILVDPSNVAVTFSVNDDNVVLDNCTFTVTDFVDDRQIVSDTVGLVHKIKVADGDKVMKGDVLLEVEAMKMLMPIVSKTSGTFKKHVSEGALFSKGELLCTVEQTDTIVKNDTSLKSLNLTKSLFTDISSAHQDYDAFYKTCTHHTLYQQFFQKYPNKVEEWVLWMNGNKYEPLKETHRNVDIEDLLHMLAFSFDAVTYRMYDTGIDCGLKVWNCIFNSRRIIVVGNDTKNNAGSMSYKESKAFYNALHEARVQKVPFVYLSGTAGARVGLRHDLVEHVLISEDNSYVYLDNIEQFKNDVTFTKLENGRYKIDSIKGNPGFGVENLAGSALIAGEMSRAYNEIPTITYVFNHSTGIGAYLARLSGRVIQHEHASLLLTGANALNELLGKKIYKSNFQLGGAKEIMSLNGIAHSVVDSDESACQYIKQIITNKYPEMNHVLLDSGQEYMSNYAKTVRVYRGTINDKPYGLIEPNDGIVHVTCRIDHADPNSHEVTTQKANYVLYPETSYKIAQFMHECNIEKLPLVIIANWRGFSGGTKDMFESVLKYGSMIVEQMAHYKHDIHVFIPPNGQLRGGSWVVFDPSLNLNKIKFYAAPDSRGSILEPNGLCNVKQKVFKDTHFKDNKAAQQLFASLHNKPECFKKNIDSIETYESLKRKL